MEYVIASSIGILLGFLAVCAADGWYEDTVIPLAYISLGCLIVIVLLGEIYSAR